MPQEFAVSPDIMAHRLPEPTYQANFADLHPPLGHHEAHVAADRCLFCWEAPCVAACPTGIDIPLFIRQISTGNPLAAAKTILDANIMGGMCARVCPTETLCEQACVREASEGAPVRIGLLQRHATDALLSSGHQPYRQGAPTGRSVAVVGAGPAGLACAHKLATLGHAVTLFEAREKPAGLNEYGIATYKTPGDFAAREAAFILDVGGITLKTGVALGRDITLASLQADHDAVFLGIGLGAVNALVLEAPGLEAETLPGVEDAVAFIARLRQATHPGDIAIGRRIVVIGGGMTAIDIAAQAKRLGAEEVTIVYRRGPEAMSASRYEQELAQTDGVLIRHWLKPVELVSRGGVTTGIIFEYTKLEGGKLVGTGEQLTLACDQVFKAIGQRLDDRVDDVTALVLKDGRISVDGERRTSLSGVWAGGDCVTGGEDLTVVAVEDGKQAALSIDRTLRTPTTI
jgi:dihydropyrimidine dehydrogenase (NAD+) subunit PreT